MFLWIILAFLTAAAIAFIARPLARAQTDDDDPAPSESDIFKSQLAEIEHDEFRGVLSGAEAEAARIEVSRRLLRAAENERRASAARVSVATSQRNLAIAVVTVLVPSIALSAYLVYGSPGMPDRPFAERLVEPEEGLQVAGLVAQVEERLRENPRDGEGWDVIAPVYMRLQRFDDAVYAYSQVLRLKGETPERLEGLGEAMLMTNGGIVSERARMAFGRALALDPALTKSRFWLGMANEQDGRFADAVSNYRELLQLAPPDASWRPMVGARLAMLEERIRSQSTTSDASDAAAQTPRPETSGPAPSPEQMAAARQMSPEDRGAMIEQMVAGLASRLAENGNDLDGWLRLMRAYMVLGKPDDARKALAAAQEQFREDDAALITISAAARSLGLDS
jgi:cytochrome c-type biogenesis protein CcmH